MSSQLGTPREAGSPAPERFDGEIYISLRKKSLHFRGALLLSMLGFASASAALAGYLQMASVQGGKYSKGETQCPGVSPAQKIAAQPKKG